MKGWLRGFYDDIAFPVPRRETGVRPWHIRGEVMEVLGALRYSKARVTTIATSPIRQHNAIASGIVLPALNLEMYIHCFGHGYR